MQDLVDTLRWDDLRFLLAVVRAGSFSAAAQALTVEQSTVSRRIAALEGVLGTALFGPSALVTLIALRERPVWLPCPNCGGRRPLDQSACPHCSHLFTGPERDGTEILASTVAETTANQLAPALAGH